MVFSEMNKVEVEEKCKKKRNGDLYPKDVQNLVAALQNTGDGQAKTKVRSLPLKDVTPRQTGAYDAAVKAIAAVSKQPQSACEDWKVNENYCSFQGIPKLYPDIKGLDYDLESFHATIVDVENGFKHQANSIAYKGYQAFLQENTDLEKHSFYDLVAQFETSRLKLIAARKKLKEVHLSARVKVEDLWTTIPKQIPIKAKCDDGSPVECIYEYEWKELSTDALSTLVSSTHELEKSVIPELIFQEYATQVSRIRLEYYMFSLMKDILSSTKGSAVIRSSSPAVRQATSFLRTCISILFHFQRKPSKDVQFINATRKWLKNLVSTLLCTGTFDDDLFILNNVMRCPSGVSSWATSFLQWHPSYLRPCVNSYDCLNYCLAAIFVIMTPVPGRQELLSNIKICHGRSDSGSPCDCCFVVLDSEGEEEYEAKRDWTEEDFISLFGQISFSSIYALSRGSYSVPLHAEAELQKTIALCSFLFEVCQYGLDCHHSSQYKRVHEAIGNFMCEAFKCLADDWEEFKSLNSSYSCCLQIEVDRLFVHAVYCMFASNQSEILKSMEKLPYDCISPKVLWNILWIFHAQRNCQEDSILKERDVDRKLASKSNRILLIDKLSELTASDGVHVLRSMKSMALSRSSEKAYVSLISKEMFEVLLAKSDDIEIVEEASCVISCLVENCPFGVSSLLEVLSDAEDIQFQTALQLFSTLNLMHWIPKDADVRLLSDWLLCGSLSLAKCQIAMSVLGNLNYGFEDGELVLPIALQREVGMIVVKAYEKYDASASTWFVSRGIEQMLQLYAVIRNQKFESDNGFVAWAWNLLFSLKLHIMSLPNPPWVRIFDGSVMDEDDIPDINDEEHFSDLLLAYKEKQPAACFLVLAMTNVGHCIKSLSVEGINILSTLLELKQYAAAIQALYFILPFFVKHHECLISNNVFICHFNDLVHADQVSLQFEGETGVGSVLLMMHDMMKIQIHRALQLTVECAIPLIKLWQQILVELLLLQNQKVLMSTPNQVCYLLDSLAKIAFRHPCTLNGFLDVLVPLIERNRPTEDRRSIWKMIFGNGIKTSSLLQLEASLSYVWFSWCVIQTEMNRKGIEDLWSAVLKEMAADVKATPETAFKSVSSRYPALSFSLHDLPVYRWCVLALLTPVSHHLLPLVCQNFFRYYLRRINVSGSSQKCVGTRFFKSGLYTTALKKMHAKLKEAIEFYQKAVDSSSCENVCSDSPNGVVDSRLKFQKKYLSILTAFLRWIEDADLSGPVCFPALNPEYDPEKLKLILDFDRRPWFDLLDLPTIEAEVLPKSSLWRTPNASRSSSVNFNGSTTPIDCSIASSKSENIEPLAPPSLEKLESFLEELGSVELSSWSELRNVINKDQQALGDEAKQFQDSIEKLESINKNYKNLIQKLYKIKPTVLKVTKHCYRGSSCSGPAKINVSVNKICLDNSVREEIERNECSFTKMFEELCKPCGQKLCLAAVHAEICVSKLVQRLKITGMEASKEWCNIGVSMFYDQLMQAEGIFKLGNDHARDYPPVKQFFSTCLEVLGRELIAGNEDQLLPLVKIILSHSAIAGLASPYFRPAIASEKSYLSVYEAVVKAISPTSACAILAVFSKLKLKNYLETKNVSFLARRELLQKVRTGLVKCGPHPEGDILYIHDAFKSHFCTLLMHELPDLYDDAIEIMVNGVESASINPDVWYAVFKSLGCPLDADSYDFDKINSEIKKFARNRVLTADQKMYVWSPDLHLTQIIKTLKYFGEHFGEARRIHGERMYVRYKNFVEPISIMLGLMGCSLLDVAGSSHITSLGSKTKGVWDLLHQAFRPWIDPVIKEDVLDFPWSPDERVEARKMFKIFAMCIEFLHSDFKDEVYGNNILSCTWNYYFETYIKPGIRSYHFVVCHSALSGVPWEQFHPTNDDIDRMCEVLQCRIPECKKFFLGIFFSIPWLEAMDRLMLSSSEYSVTCYLGCMAKLVIKFSWECPAGKKSSMQKILRKLEEMPLSTLSIESAEEIINVYCKLSDPMNLLQKEDKPEIFALRFLKSMFSMMPVSEMAARPEGDMAKLKRKRIMFLRKMVALITKAIATDRRVVSNAEKFTGFFPQLLRDIDYIVSKDFHPSEQVPAAVPMVCVSLVSLNVIEDPEMNKKVLDAFLNWLTINPKTLLLLPCIKASCLCVYDVPSVVSIIECCLTSRYSAELKSSSEAEEIWNLVSACISIPDSKSEEIFTTCIEQNAFLLLYEYIYRKMSTCNNAESRAELFVKVIVGLRGRKPSEAAETKLLLVLDKAFELALITAAEFKMPVIREHLIMLCEDLSALAEDREKVGFLSTLGLGKGSTYSVNFRFICRALAAYILSQIPENADIRLERDSLGHMVLPSPESESKGAKPNGKVPSPPRPSRIALKAMDELQSLKTKKPYTALVVHVDKTVKCIYNPTYCLTDIRLLLKELALQVFPDKSYLFMLNT